jgi:hypothetical protein
VGIPNRALAAGAAAIGLSVTAGLVLAGRGRSPLPRTWMFAAASGISAAIAAMLMKLTVADLIGQGFAAAAKDWPGYLLAVTIIAAFLFEQEAFTGGSLATAVAVMSTTNPIASYFLHAIAFQVAPPHSAPAVGALLGVAALIISGVIGLARSSVVQGEFASRSGGKPAT